MSRESPLLGSSGHSPRLIHIIMGAAVFKSGASLHSEVFYESIIQHIIVSNGILSVPISAQPSFVVVGYGQNSELFNSTGQSSWKGFVTCVDATSAIWVPGYRYRLSLRRAPVRVQSTKEYCIDNLMNNSLRRFGFALSISMLPLLMMILDSCESGNDSWPL